VFHGADDRPLVAGAALVCAQVHLFRPPHCSVLRFKGAEGEDGPGGSPAMTEAGASSGEALAVLYILQE
jgi:hypothetical protein